MRKIGLAIWFLTMLGLIAIFFLSEIAQWQLIFNFRAAAFIAFIVSGTVLAVGIESKWVKFKKVTEGHGD
ncbi:MAG: hypothetical protein NZ805_08880 [Armatimonadetes bacterium]|nr:hypothetical protein [Armatimonadota bacterium]MDW8028220.1 hypothetical protein [Armatimonadota bacterium]